MRTPESFRNQPGSKSCTVEAKPARLIRLPAVLDMIGVSRSQLYRLESLSDFPARVKLGRGPTSGTAWVESEVEQWIAERIAAARREAI